MLHAFGAFESPLGETFLLDYVTRRSEKLGFKKRILPDITVKLFVFGVVRNRQEICYFETLFNIVNYIKIKVNWVRAIFCVCDRRSEKFQLM